VEQQHIGTPFGGALGARINMTVLIIVQSAIPREGLRKLLTDAGLSVTCADAGADPEVIVAVARDAGADLIVIDGNLCHPPSTLVVTIGEMLPDSRIVILTDRPGVSRIPHEAIIAADGILSSELSSEAIIQSLRLVQLGSQVISPNLTDLSLKKSDYLREVPVRAADVQDPVRGSLSPRETEIVRYLLNGCSNKAIARHLGITEATVKVHVKGLLRKIRAANRTQAAIWAVNNGISSSGGATNAARVVVAA